ncbi:MAG: bacteriorhodopsin, partial [Bdellovibrionales bacterium]|nr:bacteriorhodopsin [Bdellovibrionales bacterium]
YPIGYFFGYLTGSNPADSMSTLNIVYNFADVVNKIGFGVIIWNAAVTASESN